ncbi:MAG: phosphoribosylglycinamide formyltransferase [Wenzhouxiangella sp.]|nr:MAG: phosphoribosylglycinamide formyltransferase [Wenzhouxiangella sp.]
MSARLVVLLSGRGTNFTALQQAIEGGWLKADIRAAISDRDAAGLALAEDLGMDTVRVDRRRHPDRSSFESSLATAVAGYAPDWIVLAGFMRVLSPGFVEQFSGRMINIHPSLLPKYRGLETHARALAAGDSEHGASVHFVTPELDGGPVISQVRLPVLAGDDPERLADRLLPLEHRLLPATMALLTTTPVELRHEQILFDNQPLVEPLLLGRDLDDHGRRTGRNHVQPG